MKQNCPNSTDSPLKIIHRAKKVPFKNQNVKQLPKIWKTVKWHNNSKRYLFFLVNFFFRGRRGFLYCNPQDYRELPRAVWFKRQLLWPQCKLKQKFGSERTQYFNFSLI